MSEFSLPTHVAIIMDGNGRWAKKNNVNRVNGHNAGMEAMKRIIAKASHMGIKYLTVYAFSTENWKRSEEEVSGIFNLLVKFVARDLKEVTDENVKIKILGDYSKLPPKAKESVDNAVNSTKDNTGMQFNIALNYGSRDEIIRAVKKICTEVKNGSLDLNDVNEKLITDNLYTGIESGNVPDPDLIIRTSGEERLSNFLMWQASYSEFMFTDTLWPDFTEEEFENMVMDFSKRNRRFGGR